MRADSGDERVSGEDREDSSAGQGQEARNYGSYICHLPRGQPYAI
jgi:hypothetical protein